MNPPVMGFLNIYKEQGFTSHDAVAIVRKTLNRVKTGHTGTLDPMAEGVLPICVGRATRFAGLLTAQDKSYTAEVLLGITTDTGDRDGRVLSTRPVNVDTAAVEGAVKSFLGTYRQTPPMFSAIKINGRKLYELARKGEDIERETREVTINNIEIIFYDSSRNAFTVNVDCSKGTYIRSLCVDIGEKLGCGAHMGSLVRTRSGVFKLENAVRLEGFKRAVSEGRLSDLLIGVETIFPYKRAYISQPEWVKKAENGNPLPVSRVAGALTGEPVWLYNGDRLIGLFKPRGEVLAPEVMCL